jgi:hypothetical protein
MNTIYYSKGKIALTLLGCIAITFLGIWMWGAGHGKVAFAGFILSVVGPLGALGTAKMLISDPVALRFDSTGLSGSTMWRKFEARWSDVESVGISTTTTSSSFGLFKSRSHSLEIKLEGGLFGGKTYSISPGFLSLDSNGLEGVIDQMARARSGAPVAHAPQPVRAEAPRDSLEGLRPEVFDADAAFARYMAKQGQTADAGSVQPLPVEPPRPAYAPPARPVFGRKAA